jgi:colanic acid/amylovoran biosynthesis glycosyltransferase
VYAFYGLVPLANIKTDLVYFPWVLAADRYMDWFQANQVPVVVSLRGSMVNVAPLVPVAGENVQHTLRQVFERSTAVHCVSQDIFNTSLRYGLDPARTRVIRPAVDPDMFFPLENKPANARFTVITTGSLIWHKGYEYALMTLSNLVDKGVDAEYHIIGEGPERQRVLYTIQDLGLQDRVILHGKLPPEEVRNRLQQGDVFMLSSLSEGIANALLEAMSCGLPVVTTDCGGMREAVSDGIEGFVVPTREPEAAADALAKLSRDPALRAKMGNAGRARVQREFSLKQQIDLWIDLLTNAEKCSSLP